MRGVIPVERFDFLAKNYEAEQAKLKQKRILLRNNLAESEKMEKNIARFVSIVKRYTEITELTLEILNSFIDNIYVGQAERIDGKRVQDVKIVYKLIGAVNIPQE